MIRIKREQKMKQQHFPPPLKPGEIKPLAKTFHVTNDSLSQR